MKVDLYKRKYCKGTQIYIVKSRCYSSGQVTLLYTCFPYHTYTMPEWRVKRHYELITKE